MKGFVATVFCLVTLTTQAMALTCIRPNIGLTFNSVATSEKTYIMGRGTLTPKSKIPKYQSGIERQIPAEFTGVFYGASGLTSERRVPVIVDAICYASWCGGFPKEDSEMVVFLEQSSNGYRLESNPCDGNFKISPTPEDMEILHKCLKNGKCSQAQIQTLEADF